jgi:hypothetical protein
LKLSEKKTILEAKKLPRNQASTSKTKIITPMSSLENIEPAAQQPPQKKNKF